MSFLLTAPEALVNAASDLVGIGTGLDTARSAAAAPTTGILAAAEDEISTQIAALFSAHGVGFQQLTAQVSAFHQQFTAALTSGANAYAQAEAGAAQTLTNAVNAPATALLGHPLLGSGAGAGIGSLAAGGGALSNAAAGLLARGAAAASQAGALLLGPTGGVSALTAAGALLSPAAITAAAAVPAANAFAPIATSIENAYLQIEPWVQYGFELLTYAAGWVPYVGILAPQIMFFYNLIEPIVQSGLFNTLDWLAGEISFAQGLSNFWAATTASINYFVNTEIYWVLGFLPPLPPLPPLT
ncbi:PE family protein [Mycobacterium saskatchewanense]|uniref:PE family protein n=1 Tax=Mycobacterium saskatchewanense TaxID=220927 RepID=A0AAJ3TT09_9MYCO|nr:PE family protein [Mycobacterium saskatchewanense]ORW64888.1 PE family protein [Mycobacterium saskatchewanense]